MHLKRETSIERQHRAVNAKRTVMFLLGTVCATPGARDLLDRTATDAERFLDRHQGGDVGNMGAQDARANKDAITDGARILLSYSIGGERLWVITEADRSSTTLLLPDEY